MAVVKLELPEKGSVTNFAVTIVKRSNDAEKSIKSAVEVISCPILKAEAY